MANNSIKTAFERMWQHILSKLGDVTAQIIKNKEDIQNLSNDISTHQTNEFLHIREVERINWDTAAQHAISAHAPSNAQANQNAFSIINVVDSGISTFASAPESPGGGSIYVCNASSATDELTLVAGSLMQMYPSSSNEITLGINIEAFDALANSCVEANRIGAASATEFDDVKARLNNMTTETWTFELEDGTTVTKKVVLG